MSKIIIKLTDTGDTNSVKRLLVFFIGAICACCVCVNFANAKESVVVKNGQAEFVLDMGCDSGSLLRQSINKMDCDDQVKVIEKILAMGFTLQDALQYVYPNLVQSIEKMCKQIEKMPQNPTVYTDKNSCKINFKNAKNGIKIDKNILFSDLFDVVRYGGNIGIETVEVLPDVSMEDFMKCFVLVSSFETDFSTSSSERKNNIKLAMQSVDGKFIKSGETLSFNQATGARCLENGYKSAKIIKNGEYVEGLGGGVCQVSTTLYNACVLAGLTISEVHNHSLPAGYVLPGFDAMVNTGTADLKITNNTQHDFLITTCSNQDKCKICIYGVMPKYKIQRRFDKYQDLPAGDDLVETDSAKYGNFTEPGEYRIVSQKDGYRVKSYLDYYENGVLIKSEQVRDCTYLPRKGVVVKVE